MKLLAVFVIAMLTAAGVEAQERGWELEAYGGAVVARTATGESPRLPPAGAPLPTSNPIFPTREVPSWFFGDGAALFNGVAAEFGTATIESIDRVFAVPAPGRTGVAGARLRRRLSSRFAAEVSVDFLGRSGVAPEDLGDVVDRARASYVTAFGELLTTGPFTNVVVGADGGTSGSRRQELAATAALNWDLTGDGRPLIPYVTAGAGLTTGSGSVSAAINGQYRFSILGEVPVRELDSVTVRFERRTAFAAVLGGGLRRDLSEKWGVRIDARAYVGPDSTRITLTTASSITRGTPAGFVESFTSPAIQFSNDPATGRRSSLSAPPLEDFRVFSGGTEIRTLITFGVSRRF